MTIADYGNYIYNGNLFHSDDDVRIDDYERLWGPQLKLGLGEYQMQVKSRDMISALAGVIGIAVGAASVGICLIDDDYPGGRPLYNIIFLVSIGLVFWLMALVQLANINNRIILYERGLVYATCFGLRRRTVFYRNIEQISIEPHHIVKHGCTVDSYMIIADRKRFCWTSDNFTGLGPVIELLLARCFVKIN